MPPVAMQQKRKVGILGATGTVGQRFIVLIAQHPYFEVSVLGASARSAGKPYKDAVKWKQSTPIPKVVLDLPVQECQPEAFKDCTVVFSGLDSDVAGPIEAAFREAELAVFSNSKNYRRDPLVPLIVPLVNTHHFDVVPHQKQVCQKQKGFIITNANCSTTGLVVPLKALEDAFGPLQTVMATTLQAISGGGYPGVPSLDILDNIVPYISGEEDKLEWETSKILGGVKSDKTGFDHREHQPIKVSATCTRVPVIDGHLECVSVKFKQSPPPSVAQVEEALRKFRCEAQDLSCPSAPEQAIFVHDEQDRPQPRLDRYYQDGAGVSVGRVRECPVLDIKFVVLANNVSIGAATSSLINAEVAVSKGII